MTQPPQEPLRPSSGPDNRYAAQPGAYAGRPDPYAGQPDPYAGQPGFQPTFQPGGGHSPARLADERGWATLAHVVPLVAMVLSAGFLGFVGSLVIYLLYRDRGPFVRQHAANSLNVQITLFIALVISVPLMLVLVGFVTYAFAIVAAFVIHIVAAIKANRGEWYTPPMTARFVK